MKKTGSEGRERYIRRISPHLSPLVRFRNSMKYSRKEIDRAGKVIISASPDLFEQADAIVKVDDWRKLHLPVIELLSSHVAALFDKKGIAVAFSSQRLKRMTSIKEKLMRSATMGLGGVQDIFKLVSAIFALREHQPVNASFKDMTEEQYCVR